MCSTLTSLEPRRPSIFGWPHETTPEALARNVEGLKIAGEILSPMAEVAKPYAEKAGLQIDWNDPAATLSKLAVITQTPREFDYPDIQLACSSFTMRVLFTTMEAERRCHFHGTS